MSTLPRAIIRVSALVVPRDIRAGWTEEWLGELCALIEEGSTRRDCLRFALGAPRHALVEALDEWTAGLVHDTHLAARRLAREPGFCAACIAIMAVAVTANAAIFSVVNAVFLRTPPGIGGGERLVQLGRVKASGAFDSFSFPAFTDIRTAQPPALEAVAAYAEDRFAVGEGTAVRYVTGQIVSAGYFSALHAPLAEGREFTLDEERGFGAVVVLGDELWRRDFNRDPAVLGRILTIDGVRSRIVGIAPPRFIGVNIGTLAPALWVPAGFGGDAARDRLGDRLRSWVWPIGRLRDGASIEQVRAQLAPIHAAIEREHTGTVGAAIGVVAGAGLTPDARGDARRVTLLLFGSVAVVLAIACANVAGLTLARAVGRRRELAVRLAIGASRFRLARDAVIESVLLASVAGGVAMALVRWTASGVRHLMPYQLAVGFEPDGRVLAVTLGGAALTGLLLGILPARRAARADLMGVMREASSAGGMARARTALVILQLALSFALVAGAGVLTRSLAIAAGARPGFDPDAVVVASVVFGRAEAEAARTAAATAAVVERIRAVPGVEQVSAVSRVPIVDVLSRRSVGRDDTGASLDEPLASPWTAIDPAYFAVMRIPIARGRAFAAADGGGSPKVAIVSASLARRVWGDTDPIGRQMRAGFDRVQVVGIARDVAATTLGDRTKWLVYLPLAQQQAGNVTIVARATSSLASGQVVTSIRDVLSQGADGAALDRASTLRDLLAASMGETRLTATLLGIYGSIAFLLSVVGVYALQAQRARQRRREFGVRLALGASPQRLQRAVIAGALRLAAAGVGAGLAVAWLFHAALDRLVFGVASADPPTLAVSAGLFVVAAVVAAVGPARYAGGVDPLASIRQD